MTLAEAKPLEFPTTELTCATVTPPVPQGQFYTHVLGSLQILPSHPTLLLPSTPLTVMEFLSVLNASFLPNFWLGLVDFSPSGIFFIAYYFSS